jgi:tRNA (guanine-N7-)-methyltransferase
MLNESSFGEKNHIFRPDFQYKHKNPYHDKLAAFDGFVLRDDEGEKLRGSWSKEAFKNNKDLEVEIGTGFGHFMHEHCQRNPDINFVGMDQKFKRSFELARRLNKLENKNFKYLRAKGERLGFLFDENEVSKMYYFFPDPWPKNRHNKKRLFQMPFLEAAHKVLKPNGTLFVKTDHNVYFEWMCDFVDRQDFFDVKMITRDLYQDEPEHFLASFQTKFEKIFLRNGDKIKAMELLAKK